MACHPLVTVFVQEEEEDEEGKGAKTVWFRIFSLVVVCRFVFLDPIGKHVSMVPKRRHQTRWLVETAGLSWVDDRIVCTGLVGARL